MTTKFTTTIAPPEPPPPPGQDGRIDPEYTSRLYRWLYEVYRRLEQAGLLDWDAIKLSDGTLTDLGNIVHTHKTAGQGGPIYLPVTTTAVDYTVTTTDEAIKCTAAVTITLPTAVGVEGRRYRIDNATASSTVTVSPTGSETIEGETSQPVPAGSCMVVYSDGSGWRIT